MTEAEWLAWSRPKRMFGFLLGTDYPRVQDRDSFPDCKGSDRKLRLFACACYHRVRHLLPHALAQDAVEVAERFADGTATPEDLQQAEARVWGPLDAMEAQWRASRGAERAALAPTHEALALALQCVWASAPKAAYYASSNAYLACAVNQAAEERAQADLLRCIFGALFHPSPLAPVVLAWNDGTVVKLAQGIYQERAFDRMPILADALEDAGCDDAVLVGHCRSATPHARGCWVVDVILGRK